MDNVVESFEGFRDLYLTLPSSRCGKELYPSLRSNSFRTTSDVEAPFVARDAYRWEVDSPATLKWNSELIRSQFEA